MYTVRVRPRAEAQFDDAFKWYEERREGQGTEFAEAFGQTIFLLSQNPYLFQPKHLEIRAALIERFPFFIFYVVAGEEVSVLAVLHFRRDPKLWKKRL